MSVQYRPSLTLSILHTYYCTVKDLRTYLNELLKHDAVQNGEQHDFIPAEADSAEYHLLINTSYVASVLPDAPKARYKFFPPMMYMRDVGCSLLSFAMICDRSRDRRSLTKLKRSCLLWPEGGQ